MEGWKHQTPYSFHVTHRPSIGLIRWPQIFGGKQVLLLKFREDSRFKLLKSGGKPGFVVKIRGKKQVLVLKFGEKNWFYCYISRKNFLLLKFQENSIYC